MLLDIHVLLNNKKEIFVALSCQNCLCERATICVVCKVHCLSGSLLGVKNLEQSSIGKTTCTRKLIRLR
jgi:hypothetical protein